MTTRLPALARASLLLLAAVSAGLSGCTQDDDYGAPSFLAGYLASDPCAAARDATACGAVDGCGWHSLEVECPASTSCPVGFCASADPCRDHADASACTGDAANGCAWAHRDHMCLGNHDCEDAGGYCYQRALGDGDCACLCPMYCPSGDCPGCECDCAVTGGGDPGPGGTCACACETCGPGESCAPCDCECAGSTAPGAGGCVGDATCTCACEDCPDGQSCPPCDCECHGENGGDTTPSCVCPPCIDGASCDPCACEGDACGGHGNEADCNADAAGCAWVPVQQMHCGMDMGGCHQGVCRSQSAAMDHCTCACEGMSCACDCSQFDECTPPIG